MKPEHVTALKQLSQMLQSGKINDATISQKVQFVVAIESGIRSEIHYESRCRAAEDVIASHHCDVGTTMRQIEAHKNWEAIKKELL